MAAEPGWRRTIACCALLLGPGLLPAASGVPTPTSGAAQGSARRAVVVGIDRYRVESDSEASSARGLTDLEHAVADALGIRQMLVGVYGFDAADVHLLLAPRGQGEAIPWDFRPPTRANILDAIDQQLVAAAEPGDEIFFYFSGHGSQLLDLRSTEQDRRDETLVPADAARGAADIRDKELRRRFNAVLDRGARLTVVIDSCHSGSVTRGLRAPRRALKAVRPQLSSADPDRADPGPDPADRGAVIISASLEAQPAADGVFTPALLDAVRSAPRGETVSGLVRRASTLVHAQGYRQQPGLQASPEAARRPLLAPANDAATPQITAHVIDKDPESGLVRLDAGLALGIHTGTRMISVLENPATRLRIESSTLATSDGRVTGGDVESIGVGESFRVARWVVPAAARLRLFVGPGAGTEETTAALAEMAVIRSELGDRIVLDPTETEAAVQVFFAAGAWHVRSGESETRAAPGDLRRELDELVSGDPTTRVFVDIPAPDDFAAALSSALTSGSASVEIVESAAEAHYRLVGRSNAGAPEFAWVLPGASAAAWDSTLPVRSDWQPLDLSDPVPAVARLRDAATRAARVHGWLTLAAPAEAANDSSDQTPFAYRPAFVDAASGALVQDGGWLDAGASYQLVLVADDAALPRPRRSMAQRYVYVFSLDQDGSGSLLFPLPTTGSYHTLWPRPLDVYGGQRYPRQIPLWDRPELEVSLPAGVDTAIDTLVMVTTREPLPADPRVIFNFAGVRRQRGDSSDPLVQLLHGVGATRSAMATRPGAWSVQRQTLRTRRRPSAGESPRSVHDSLSSQGPSSVQERGPRK